MTTESQSASQAVTPMRRQLILFTERHTRLLRGIANQRFPDWALGPFSWFHALLLDSNLQGWKYADMKVRVEGVPVIPDAPGEAPNRASMKEHP